MIDVHHERVLPHGTSRPGRWLRAHRLRLALVLAVAAGVFVVVDVVPWWLTILAAVAAMTFYLAAGRSLRGDSARQVSWIAAASGALVALIPVLLLLVGTLALVAVGVIAVVALVVLFSERR